MTAIFYHNEAQRKLAERTRDEEAARRGSKILTPILPLKEFTVAEDYHQKFYLRQQKDLFKEFEAIYPNVQDLYRSTAVMRVNAYLAGQGRYATLEKEIGTFGLSPAAQKKLLSIVKAHGR